MVTQRKWGYHAVAFFISFMALAPGARAASEAATAEPAKRWVQIAAKDKHERSRISSMGLSIEAVRSDSVWGFATERELAKLASAGIKVLGNFDMAIGRGGHQNTLDFPNADKRYHNYAELQIELKALVAQAPDLVAVQSIGKSVEGRDLLAIHFNTDPEALASGQSSKPGAVYMGNHHAREHLSVEIPLMWAQYLVKNREDAQVKQLLAARDIWIIPMVNPDGAEHDIAGGNYKYWRKNRAKNFDGSFGVDLNRNYGFMWGTGGSDTETWSDVYMGPKPFSEPETQAIRDFVSARANVNVLLSFHTFSELILYPWGHTYDPLDNLKDRAVFEAMATKMAGWNHYTPQPASDLYIASGDTVDWAYGTQGIFAFTFELSPSNSGFNPGGFYPGAAIIDKVFQDNLKPLLYLLDLADDPYRATSGGFSGLLRNYSQPRVPTLFD